MTKKRMLLVFFILTTCLMGYYFKPIGLNINEAQEKNRVPEVMREDELQRWSELLPYLSPKDQMTVADFMSLSEQERSKLSSRIISHITSLADQGNINDQSRLGILYLYGVGVDKDITQAMAWLSKAAVQGHAKSQVALANIYYLNDYGISVDYSKSLALYEDAMQQNYPEAFFRLGIIYRDGRAVVEDDLKSFSLMRRAAELGYPPAQFFVARYYQEGVGVIADDKEAFSWGSKAANLHQIDAYNLLGTMYESGKGVVQDLEKAILWYDKGVRSGDLNAMANLGGLYLFDNRMNGHQSEGMILLEQAGQLGSKEALEMLLTIYSERIGYKDAAKVARVQDKLNSLASDE